MSINIDEYIKLITPEGQTPISKENLISLLSSSSIHYFNHETNKIQAKIKPTKTILSIHKSDKIESKEKLIALLMNFNKTIISIKFNEDKSARLSVNMEKNIEEITQFLKSHNIQYDIEEENLKENILQSKTKLLNPYSSPFVPRKKSDNEGNVDPVKLNSDNKNSANKNYRGSLNKFDNHEYKIRAASIYQLSASNKISYNKNFPLNSYYSNEVIASIFNKLKSEAKLVYPKEFDIFEKEFYDSKPREKLDNEISQDTSDKNKISRNRAYTEAYSKFII